MGRRGCLQTDGLGAHAQAPVIRYRRPYNMTHCYATAMLMAGMTPAFCAKQLGHSVEMFLTTYSKWIDEDRTIWRWRWKGLFPPKALLR